MSCNLSETMKNRTKFLIASAFICLFLLVGIVWKRTTPITNPAEPDQAGATANSTITKRSSSQKTDLITNLNPQSPSNAEDTSTELTWREQDLLRQWKVPIEFFGKVVDENDQPVSGVRARFSWIDLSPAGTDEREVLSDAQGLFSLMGVTGKKLNVYLGKGGYYVPKKEFGRAFEYAEPLAPGYHRPNRDSPVVFRIRRKGTTEPLLAAQKLFGFKVDGTPFYIDLISGKKFAQSPPRWDLAVRFNRSTLDVNHKFDWSVAFEVSEGGLLETNEEFMFLAPIDGYQHTIEITQFAANPDWTRQASKKFFLKSRSGQIYGRIEMTIMPWYQKETAIDILYFLNTNGSRNLEYGPTVEQK